MKTWVNASSFTTEEERWNRRIDTDRRRRLPLSFHCHEDCRVCFNLMSDCAFPIVRKANSMLVGYKWQMLVVVCLWVYRSKAAITTNRKAAAGCKLLLFFFYSRRYRFWSAQNFDSGDNAQGWHAKPSTKRSPILVVTTFDCA